MSWSILSKQQGVGLDHFTITYISHIVIVRFFCFNSLKTTLWAYIDVWTLANKGRVMKKEYLTQWVSFALKKTLTPYNM